MRSPSFTREWARCPYRAVTLREIELVGEERKWLNLGSLVNTYITKGFEVEVPLAQQPLMKTAKVIAQRLTALTNALVNGGRVLVMDETMFEGENARPDLIWCDAAQRLHVLDWKVKRRVPHDMSSWDWDWQLWHYVSMCARAFGVPVDYTVCMATVEPKIDAFTYTVPVTVERLNEWQSQNSELQEEIAQAGVPARRWTGCSTPYYPCELIAHCHRGATLDTISQPREETS